MPSLPIPGYRGLRFGLPAAADLQRLWSATLPSVVHVATEGPLGASAIAAARRLDLPVSSSYHTNFDAYSRHYGFGWLRRPIASHLRRFHNRTDLTLVPTRGLAQTLAATGYQKLAVMARGVDTRLFSPHRRSDALRAAWGAGPDDLVIAHVGRLAREKNLALVVEAFHAIERACPGARMLFVGDGPERAGLARRHRQHIFAGMRHGEDLARHYASADLFLFPSLTETFGNVVPEALASGLGVVAFAKAAAADLIEDGINGCLVATGDSRAFVAAATKLAMDRQWLATMRGLAAPSVAPLDWEHIHDCFADALANLVVTHQRRRRGEKYFILAPD